MLDQEVMPTYYYFTDARSVLEKIEREREKLRSAINSQTPTEIADSVFNFAVTAYHVKDWLQDQGTTDHETYINNNQELRICADLCNGSKHKTLTRNIRESTDPIQKVEISPLTADMTTITADSTITINGHTVRVHLKSGKEIEILHLAEQVEKLWKTYFSNNGI